MNPNYFLIQWLVSPAREEDGDETADAAGQDFEDRVEALAWERYGLSSVGPDATIVIEFYDDRHYTVKAAPAALDA
jgi:hypothetical protein